MKYTLKKWIREERASVLRRNGLFFLIPESPIADDLKSRISRFDALLKRCFVLKASATTTAGVTSINPEFPPVFIKRTNNKGFKFTCRYLFRHEKAFRAALAASCVKAAGVDTPKVYAVGERRFGRILLASYLVTETSTEIQALTTYLKNVTMPDVLMRDILPQLIKIAATLHKEGIIHGNLKLANFFVRFDNEGAASYGVWDLDSAHIFHGKPPRKKVARELARMLTAIIFFADITPSVPDSFFSLPTLIQTILRLYQAAAGPDMYVPSEDEILKIADARWFSRIQVSHKLIR